MIFTVKPEYKNIIKFYKNTSWIEYAILLTGLMILAIGGFFCCVCLLRNKNQEIIGETSHNSSKNLIDPKTLNIIDL